VSAPLVTIGIPCFNGADYLQDALDSIRAQDYTNLEILIADNASTDDSTTIAAAAAAADSRVGVLRSPENRGAAWNYNRLVESATGKYFKWAAHDDLCLPGNVSSCVAVLEARSDVVLVYPQTAIIGSGGEVVKPYDENMDLDFEGDIRRGAALLWRVGLCNPVFGLIRTDTLRMTPMIQSFDSSDVSLLAELAMRGRFVQTEGRLFQRRRHSADSRAANRTSAEVSTWFSPTAAQTGRSRPLLKSYFRVAKSWAPNRRSAVAAGAMFAAVGPLSELRWHRRRRRRSRRHGLTR